MPDASFAAVRIEAARSRRVRKADRWWDLLAVLFVGGGAGLFLLGRQALKALAAGTYRVPSGVTYVAATDLHVAQTRLALWLVGTGLAVGILAAVRHHRRGRAAGPAPGRSR